MTKQPKLSFWRRLLRRLICLIAGEEYWDERER